MSRRILSLLLVLLTAGALVATPALAEDRPSRRGDAAQVRVMDLPDVDAAVKLRCESRVAHGEGAVHCRWRAGADLAVRSWQLWNLQVRPTQGVRNLVAELGSDARGFTDTHVEVPAAYLYAVLGLDGAGEIVARSRVVSVTLPPSDRIEVLHLGCEAFAGAKVAADALVRDRPTIGCKWSPAHSRAVAGYVLWRAVDGGHREAIARVGADITTHRDHAVAAGHRYTYVVQAVDGHGRLVGLSRPVTVSLPPYDTTDVRPDVRPEVIDVRPAETDVRPDVGPVETDVRPDVEPEKTDVRPDVEPEKTIETDGAEAIDTEPLAVDRLARHRAAD